MIGLMIRTVPAGTSLANTDREDVGSVHFSPLKKVLMYPPAPSSQLNAVEPKNLQPPASAGLAAMLLMLSMTTRLRYLMVFMVS